MARDIGTYDWERLEINRRTLLKLDNESIIERLEEEWMNTDELFDAVVTVFNDIFKGTGDAVRPALGAAVVCALRSHSRRANSKDIADILSCSHHSILDRVKDTTVPITTPEVVLRDIVNDKDRINDSDYEQARKELMEIRPEEGSGRQADVLAAVATYRAVNNDILPIEQGEKAIISQKQIADWFNVERETVTQAHNELP